MKAERFIESHKDRILTNIDGIIIHSPFSEHIGQDIKTAKLKRKYRGTERPVVDCEFTWILEKHRIRQNQGVIQEACFQWELADQLGLMMLDLYHSNIAMRCCPVEDYRTGFDWNYNHLDSKSVFEGSRGAHSFCTGYWNDEVLLTFYLHDKWTDANLRAEGFQ